MLATVLAETAPTGATIGLFLIPVLATVALVSWLTLTLQASSRKVHPERRNDQFNYRGMEQGGYYTYTPGMYSHSYPPDRLLQPAEFRKDNPQPGREPKIPG